MQREKACTVQGVEGSQAHLASRQESASKQLSVLAQKGSREHPAGCQKAQSRPHVGPPRWWQVWEGLCSRRTALALPWAVAGGPQAAGAQEVEEQAFCKKGKNLSFVLHEAGLSHIYKSDTNGLLVLRDWADLDALLGCLSAIVSPQ